MPGKLPAAATLNDLRSSPSEQVAFARKVLGTMHKAVKDHGPVTLRIGVTETGQLPNYRLEDRDDALLAAIDGNTHQPWSTNTSVDGANAWSTATMTYEDIQGVIARLTEHRGRNGG